MLSVGEVGEAGLCDPPNLPKEVEGLHHVWARCMEAAEVSWSAKAFQSSMEAVLALVEQKAEIRVQCPLFFNKASSRSSLRNVQYGHELCANLSAWGCAISPIVLQHAHQILRISRKSKQVVSFFPLYLSLVGVGNLALLTLSEMEK